tara:strand:- start:20840 stop:26995 length:6156 start_codon:yes stop_codon:yes gene_type:complete
MATINHSSGADIIVPSNNGDTYRGLAGDDTYIISNGIAANAEITIVDTSGSNKIQLVDGLGISSSKFAADAVQLTLTNGAVVTINGASNFTYDLGGNATSGVSGTSNTLAEFAAGMGVATLPTSGSTAGSSDVSISNNGVSGSAAPTFTVTKSASKISEGGEVTFTITASSAVSADTTFSWSAMGDTNGSTVTAAANSDINVLSGSATIASGGTSTTFAVGAVSDSIVEGLEGVKVSVFDADANALSTSNILFDNAGSAATSSSFTGTTGVNNFTGGAGDDSFDFSTAASFQDIDALDGGDGTDTLTISYGAAASLKPDLENIEKVVITNTAAATNALVINTVDTASGYSHITNLSSTGHVTLNNLGTLPTKVTLNNSSDTLTLDLEAGALAATDDNLHVDISGTATAATNLTITADGTADLETLTLNSIAQANTIATLTTADVDVNKLVVTGDQSLTITNAINSEILTVDASASTGGLTLSAAPSAVLGINITGGAGNDSFNGTAAGADTISAGAGADTITMSSLNALDAIDGGDGADRLVVDQAIASATVMGGVSNVETLEVTGARALTLSGNVSTTTFDFTANTQQTLTVDEGYTDEITVQFAKLGAAALVVDDALTDGFTNLANVTSHVYVNSQDLDGDTDEATITGGTGTDTLYVYLSGNPANHDAADEVGDSVTNFENITIMDSPFGNTATTLDLGADFDQPGLKNITIDASSLDALDGAVLVIDASDVAADSTGLSKITMTDGEGPTNFTAGNNADTITMGGGNDTVVGTAGANVIDMGAGNDSVTAGTGIENISGGAGNDTINVGGNLTALDTIDGGDGTDTLTSSASYASATILGGVSNVENLTLTGDGASATFAANLSMSDFTLTSTDDQTLTFALGYTDAATITIGTGSNNTSEDSITNSGATNANNNLTVTGVAGAWTGTTVSAGTGTDTVVILQGAADTTAALGSTVTGVENFTITDYTLSNTADVDVTVTSYATAATWDATSLDAGEDSTLNLTGATAAQVLKGGGGADAITGGTLGDTIHGNGGIDAINGGTGLDNIDGGAGNDVITASTEAAFSTTLGTDTVDGGAGTDTLAFSAAATLTTAEVANVSNVEVLSLTTGSTLTVNDAFLAANPGIVIQPGATSTIKASTATGDSLSTSLNISANAAGNLSVLGGSGDDTFKFFQTENLTALDSLNGGAGTDTIIIDLVDGATGTTGVDTTAVLDVGLTNIEKVEILDRATNDGGANATTITTATVTVNAGFTGTSLTIDGSTLDAHPTTLTSGERLTASAANNLATEVVTILGGAFSDSLTGGAGADTLTGNAGADTLTGGAGNDVITGGAGADSLYGGAGIDNISAGAGNDTIAVTTLTDFKTTGGAETVDGGAGTDTLQFAEATTLTITAPEMEAISGIEIIDASNTTGANQTTITLGNGFFTSNGSSSITIDGNDTADNAADHYIDLSSVTNGAVIFYPNNAQLGAVDSLYGGSGNDTLILTGTTANTSLGTADVFNGNGGTDTLSIISTGNVTATLDFSNVTNVEQAVLSADSTGAIDLDLGAVATTDSEPATFLVDASVVKTSTGTLTFNKSDNATSAMATVFTVNGTVNADTVYGGYQGDTITGNGGADRLYGEEGADTITGGSGADSISGGAGADNLTAAGGADTILGGAGNDTISAGDGVDLVTGGAGKDTITLGAGADTYIAAAITDSAGANYDVITDFVSASDNIRVTHTFTAATTFAATDRGNTASDGTLPGIMAGAIGDAAFITDGSAIAIDFTGDGIVNANDFKVSITGATDLVLSDLDFYLTGANAANSFKTSGGNDVIVGGTGVDTIYTYAGNDTITGSAGNDVIWAGAGNDTITIAGGTETVVIQAGNGTDSIIGATAGTDVLQFSMDDTTPSTATGENAVVGEIDTDAVANGAAYDFTANTGSVSTSTIDIANLDVADTPNTANANLHDDVSTGGAAALFVAMATSGQNEGIGSITVTTAGDKFYISAYDDGTQSMYIYHANSAAVISDTSITVNEVTLVAVVDGVADDALAAGATYKMIDLTTYDSAY